jgi:hypothetical protein
MKELPDFNIKRRTNMAPDKIYVPQHNIEAGNIQELDEFIVADSTEYIRKDALLKWLKERRAEHSFEVRKAYQRTIEKIESL